MLRQDSRARWESLWVSINEIISVIDSDIKHNAFFDSGDKCNLEYLLHQITEARETVARVVQRLG